VKAGNDAGDLFIHWLLRIFGLDDPAGGGVRAGSRLRMVRGHEQRGLRTWLAARAAGASTRRSPFLHLSRRAAAAAESPEPQADVPAEETADLPALPTSPAAARRFVAAALWKLGADAGAISTASLLTSELVTNSVVHANSAVRVAVGMRDRCLRVAVTDFVPGEVAPRAIDLERPNGRGLLLVSMLATSWSVEPTPGGKTVCFELMT
jgi:anti-sigma regulatory factor (Ser/Thr protein kinase)